MKQTQRQHCGLSFCPCFLTHTVLLLYELDQLLQDFIQNPADTRQEGSAGDAHFLLRRKDCAAPVFDVEVLAQMKVFE